MKKTFSYASFGCRVNQAEMNEIANQLINLGFKYSAEDYSIFIINSCAVTQKAEREVRSLIYQINKKYPNTKIIITGCAVTYWEKNNLYNKLPIFLAINNLYKENLVKLLLKRLSEQAKSNLGGSIRTVRINQSYLFFDKYLTSGRHLIKIQDGCHRFCTYCIVPYLRGRPKSQRIINIINEINNLPKNIKEVILTAINTEAYGKDTGESFVDLINEILHKTNINRLGFGSINPWSLNDNFITLYKDYKDSHRFVDFFHIPLQSGSNKILKLMKRGYTGEEFLEKLNKIKKINPLAFIATDVIVGFLDETDKEFEDTYQFLKKSPISKFHIFRFSKRNNTAAFYLAKKIKEADENTKIKRSQILRALSKIKYEKFIQRHINKIFSCLFLNEINNNHQHVLLQNQIPAWIKTNKNLSGEIRDVKIDMLKDDKLFGKIV